MFNEEKYQPIVRAYYNSKEEIVKVIVLLNEAGASFIETLWVLKHETSISLAELKEITLNSPSWVHEKEYIEKVNRIAWDHLFSREILKNDDNSFN